MAIAFQSTATQPQERNATKQTKTPVDAQNKPKRRKCTYAERREQAKLLHEEVRRLESEVAVLKIRSTDSSQVPVGDRVLEQAAVKNALLRHSAREQQVQIAKAQSAMSRCMGCQNAHPLYTRICLPKDWSQRQAKLLGIYELKLRRAYNFVMDPKRLIDPSKAQFSDERFETSRGDFCGVRFETVHFPGVKSLQQVYDAAVYYLTNMEISITERLGHITVRDDYETIGGNVYNARVMSTNQHNVVIETSSLLFTKLDVDAGYGMVVLDSVDEDELYPYSPAGRVRKDISATAIFTINRNLSGGGEGELVVTMYRAAFLKIHRPQFPLSDSALQELSDEIMAWGDVMLKTVRSAVYGS
ncbi:hypothetical protein PHYBOEH_007034 [Phytophthora boehmeriae]|uniref:Uncharacterized protein n=1 Tax=Phytophthora boehmeriae TaxID=109152 RepID=A0A8T1WDU2_9STRA|nr:hypothetical protein PHYBOEH_007034 [Phytophthora boehmeriae]